MRKLIRSEGFTLESEKNHLKWRHIKTGAQLVTSKTSSDKNSWKRVLNDIKKIKNGGSVK